MALDFPSSPSNGQVYEGYTWNDTVGAWQSIQTGAAVIVSTTAPENPFPGQLWLDSTSALMYIYYDDGDSSQWVAAVGGTVPQQGKILQVVQTLKTDTFTTTSDTFVNVTGASVTITPRATSSKVLLLGSVAISTTSSTSNRSVFVRIAGGNTSSYLGDSAESRTPAVGSPGYVTSGSEIRRLGGHISIGYLDSPATASAVTYDVQVRRGAGDTAVVGRTGADDDQVGSGRFPTVIIAMEVAG
jgi:hypothetical protein